jgi:predicted dinucleotide-binding enzyme
MQIGILGAGNIGLAAARQLIGAGHRAKLAGPQTWRSPRNLVRRAWTSGVFQVGWSP